MTPILLGLTLTLAAPAPKDRPKALDLTGEWEITVYVLGGKEAPPGVHIRFAADGMATFFGGQPAAIIVGEYTFDPKQTPAQVDIVFPGSGAGAMSGIVKRDGEGLRLCFGPPGARPSKFESPESSGVGVLTLKRIKLKD